MPLSIWFAAIAVAAAVPLSWWSVAGARATRARVRANLESGGNGFIDARKAVLEQSAQDRVMRPALVSLATRARRITPAGMVDALERRITHAGIADRWPVDRVLAMKFAGLVGGAVFGLLL